jgi:predicted Zn-dependent peptidase
LQGNATPEKAPQVLNMLRGELNTFLDEGATEDELRRVKDKWTSSMILRAESTFARMRSIASDWVHEGRLIDLDEEIERVERISVEDVMRVWRRLPLCDKQLVTALGPLSESELLA